MTSTACLPLSNLGSERSDGARTAPQPGIAAAPSGVDLAAGRDELQQRAAPSDGLLRL